MNQLIIDTLLHAYVVCAQSQHYTTIINILLININRYQTNLKEIIVHHLFNKDRI